MNQLDQNNFIPTSQSNFSSTIPNTPQIQTQSEEERKMNDAMRGKIAREQRLQKRRARAGLKEEETRRKRYQDIQHRTPHVFATPDGKQLEEIITKELTNSDVKYRRIVLPKNEAEKMLPAPINEGIEIAFKDVYSPGLKWKVRFRYWINGNSRMYVLEDAEDLVKHYQLGVGDYFSLYEDESKNMYVYTKKTCDDVPPALEQSSSNNVNLQAPNQLVDGETNEIAPSSVLEKTISMDDGDGNIDADGNGGGDGGGGEADGKGGGGGGGDDDDGDGGEPQENLDEFYESLGDIFPIS